MRSALCNGRRGLWADALPCYAEPSQFRLWRIARSLDRATAKTLAYFRALWKGLASCGGRR